MKKLMVGLLIAALFCGAAFAQTPLSVSAGARVFYNGLFTATKVTGTDFSPYDINSFGIGAFLDATYAEIGLDFMFGNYTQEGMPDDTTFSLNHFGFSVLGKYPVSLGTVTVFPLLGIDYQIFIDGQAKSGGPSTDIKRSDLNTGYEDYFDAFSIVAGGGVDYNLTEKLYLRGSFTWNFKLDSEYESDARESSDDYGIDLTLFTSGPRISLGLGYKF
ncbi:MAG: outer membrane beta-barrel protein [Spirochaetaceae bacterium]|jgi:hypothetical protein|nr:outer membrane beta-barrel protein [Spirochaetaceae bacterium]